MPTLLLIAAVLFAMIFQSPVSFAASEKRELRTCYEITDKKASKDCIQHVRGRLRSGTLKNIRPFGGTTGIKTTPVPNAPPQSRATLRQCQKFELKEDRSRCEKETLEGVRQTIFRERRQTRRVTPPVFVTPGRRPCEQFEGEERTACSQRSRALRTADTATTRQGGRQMRKP